MTTEEKAKAYDEALKKAKEIKDKIMYSHLSTESCNAVSEYIDTIIPELKENDDERIRKGLIEIFDSALGQDFLQRKAGLDRNKVIAYLEKQKESSITANDLDEEIHRFFDDCIDVHEAKLYGNISERVIPVDCYEITARHFAKWGEKQKDHKESHYTKRNALFDKYVENCDPKTVEEVNKRVDDIMNMPELSPFEQALTNFIGDWMDDEEHWPSQFVKKHGKYILNIAREELQKEQPEEPKIAFGDWGDKEKKEAIITCLQYVRFIKKITNQECDDLIKWLEDNLKEQKPVVTHGETYHVDTLGTQQVIAGKMPQKPAEPSDDELERHQKELYDFKVFAAKQAREHHISFVHDFEWNNFCAELLSYFHERKPLSYSPLCNTIKDKIREYVVNHFVTDTVVKTDVKSIVKAMEEGVRLDKEEQKTEEIDEYKIIKKHITEDVLSSEVNKRLKECGWYVTDEKPAEIPIMNGDADLYFDEWNQQQNNPTKRQCFEEGMRYAQRLQKEHRLNIEPTQRSWYMKGYHDRKYNREPRWIIKTGEGGPKYELNPRYGQPLVEEQKHYWKLTETDVALFNKAVTTNNTLTPAERAQLDIIRSKFGCCRAVNCNGIMQKEQKPSDMPPGFYLIDPDGKKFYSKEFRYGDMKMKVVEKEQKPAEKQDYSGLNDLERAILRGFLCVGVENVPVTIIKETAQDCLAQMKPAEWSEEEKQILHSFEVICQRLIENPHGEKFEVEHSYAKKMLVWLKSIKPQPKQEWSEEDEKIAKEIEEELWYPGNFPDYPSKEESELYDDCQRRLNWFKDKLKSIRPSWKPSEDDIKMLEHIIGQYETGNKNSKVMGYLPRVEELNFLKKVLIKWKNLL